MHLCALRAPGDYSKGITAHNKCNTIPIFSLSEHSAEAPQLNLARKRAQPSKILETTALDHKPICYFESNDQSSEGQLI